MESEHDSESMDLIDHKLIVYDTWKTMLQDSESDEDLKEFIASDNLSEINNLNYHQVDKILNETHAKQIEKSNTLLSIILKSDIAVLQTNTFTMKLTCINTNAARWILTHDKVHFTKFIKIWKSINEQIQMDLTEPLENTINTFEELWHTEFDKHKYHELRNLICNTLREFYYTHLM